MPAGPPRDDPECTLDRVRSPHRRRTPHHSQFSAPVIEDVHDPYSQVQLDGNAEGVEAATQVGDRSRNIDVVPDGRARASLLGRLK